MTQNKSDLRNPIKPIESNAELPLQGGNRTVSDYREGRPTNGSLKGVDAPKDMGEFRWKKRRAGVTADGNDEQLADTEEVELCVFGEQTIYSGRFYSGT